MILREGMAPAWFGLAAGLVLSVFTARLLPTLIPFNHPHDPEIYLIAVPVLVATTAVAALLPARRAARVDPTVALRCE